MCAIARWYDVLSGEWPLFRAGRLAGIDLLAASPGDVVLELGRGTGLNFPLLVDAVGKSGLVIGVDSSREMLAATRLPRDRIEQILTTDGRESQIDALFAPYALSIIPDWRAAWRGGVALVRQGGRAGIVDTQPPTGKATVLRPLAALGCALGRSDIHARPWRVLEAELSNVELTTVRSGYIVAAAGVV